MGISETTKMYSLPITDENIFRLQELATEVGAINIGGRRFGEPSWRAMVRLLAEYGRVENGVLTLDLSAQDEN